MAVNDKIINQSGRRTGKDQIVEILIATGVVRFNVESIFTAL